MTHKPSSNIENLVGVGFNRRNPHIQSTMANKSFPYRDEYEDFNYSNEETELAKGSSPFPTIYKKETVMSAYLQKTLTMYILVDFIWVLRFQGILMIEKIKNTQKMSLFFQIIARKIW